MELVLPQADKFDPSLKCYAHCSLRCAGNANKGGISLFKKEISLPYTLPEKISIASEQLKELQCLPIALPARGGAALGVAIRFASASIIRCRSASLVVVPPNHRLTGYSSMRRAPAMPHSARSPPPSKRHSRLTIVRRGCNRERLAEDSWRSHVHRTYIAQRVQFGRPLAPPAGGAIPKPAAAKTK